MQSQLLAPAAGICDAEYRRSHLVITPCHAVLYLVDAHISPPEVPHKNYQYKNHHLKELPWETPAALTRGHRFLWPMHLLWSGPAGSVFESHRMLRHIDVACREHWRVYIRCHSRVSPKGSRSIVARGDQIHTKNKHT